MWSPLPADLESRLTNRVQLTRDGFKLYLNASIDAFADDIDYAQLVKYWQRTGRSEAL